MIENREKEWQELEAKVSHILNDPRFLPADETTRQFIPTLHLWLSPTFTPDKHWFFYNPRPQLNPRPKPRVRQLIWQQQDDRERMFDPLTGLQEGFHTEPTFDMKTIEIEPELFAKFGSDLAKIRVPPFIKDEFLGLDGEQFGVETLGTYHCARITWWSSYPDDWKELVDWYDRVRKFLEEKFNDL